MVEYSEVELKVEEGSLAVINLIGDRIGLECLMNVKTLQRMSSNRLWFGLNTSRIWVTAGEF